MPPSHLQMLGVLSARTDAKVYAPRLDLDLDFTTPPDPTVIEWAMDLDFTAGFHLSGPAETALDLDFVNELYQVNLTATTDTPTSGKYLMQPHESVVPPIGGTYTIGDYSLRLYVGLDLNFVLAQEPKPPAGFNMSEGLVLDFVGGFYAKETFPPDQTLDLDFTNYTTPTLDLDFVHETYLVGSTEDVPGLYLMGPASSVASGTPILADPPYSLAWVTPFTPNDTRLGRLVLEEAIL